MNIRKIIQNKLYDVNDIAYYFLVLTKKKYLREPLLYNNVYKIIDYDAIHPIIQAIFVYYDVFYDYILLIIYISKYCDQ